MNKILSLIVMMLIVASSTLVVLAEDQKVPEERMQPILVTSTGSTPQSWDDNNTVLGTPVIYAELGDAVELKERYALVVDDLEVVYKGRLQPECMCPVESDISSPKPNTACTCPEGGYEFEVTYKGKSQEMMLNLNINSNSGIQVIRNMKSAFGYDITLLKEHNGLVVIKVDKNTVVIDDPIQITLGEKFKLEEGKNAGYVSETNAVIKYVLSFKSQCLCTVEEVCGPCPYGATFTVSTNEGESTVSINVGDTRIIYGMAIKLYEAKGGVAVLSVKFDNSIIGNPEVPVCKHAGTRSEGWYYQGKLVQYDDCACEAVDENGQYVSSCTGKVIPVEFDAGDNTLSDVLPIHVGAKTKTQVNLDSLPSMITEGHTYGEIKSVDLITTESGNSYYELKSEQTKKFLGFIPYKADVTYKVDEEGQIVE